MVSAMPTGKVKKLGVSGGVQGFLYIGVDIIR